MRYTKKVNVIILLLNMSLSPAKLKLLVQNQISQRLIAESPSKSDINFYVRKCQRLQNDLATFQDQLSSARLRLRRAEDFEIKYDLIIKQNSNLLNQNDYLTKQIQSLKVQLQKIKLKHQDQTLHQQDFSKQKTALQTEIDRLKRSLKQTQQRTTQQTKSKTEQTSQLQKKQIQKIRRQSQQRQQRFQSDIRQLKKIIAEKQTVENVIGLKVDRIRKQKQEQINRLNQTLENQRKDHESMIKQKREQLEVAQSKFEKMLNYQIQNIKLNQDNQDQLFSTEVNGLKEMIGIKNDQIGKLLNLININNNQFDKDKDELKNDITKLKEQIYKIERQNEIELYNTMERLTKIHAVDIKELEDKYRKLLESLESDKNDMEILLKQKQEQREAEIKQLERIKKQLESRIKDREMRIAELMERLKDVGATNISEIKYLHESFHKIEEQKESMATGYQQNISFMDQQIKKLTASIQLKQINIRSLEQELAVIKKNATDEQKQLLEKWKSQRKERQQDKQKYREEKQKFEQQLRAKEKQWKAKERGLQKDKERQQREKNRLTFVLEQTEKDNSRLNGYLRQLDDALKRQLKKNQLSTLDTGGARRQMVNELQRQKSELQAIKRMQVDQITKTFQIQVTKLNNQNQKLQTDLLHKSIALENLQGQMKKIENTNRNIQKINKQKMLQYQRKMATLNSEINLTQNLYQNFLQAKSRAGTNSSNVNRE